MWQLGPITLEQRLVPRWWTVLAVSILAVAAALGTAAIVFWAYGVDPVHAYRRIAEGTLLSTRGRMEILRRAIPLLLSGVGLTLAFRGKFWNIGAEGQLLAGAVAASGIALYSGIEAPWLLPAMFAGGFLAGGALGMLAAALKVKLSVNVVISTLMLNYVMLYIVEWLVHGPWKGPTMRGFAYSDFFPAAARLPVLAGSRVHWPTLVIGLGAAVLVSLVLLRTRLGYEIRVVGESPDAARYAGVSFLRVMLWVMLISGGLAGMAGVGEMAGVHFRLRSPTHISMGYGYAAIIVAWLARGNPAAVVVTSLLFGLIFASGDTIRVVLGMPFQVTDVFNGLILFFLIGSELLMHWRLRWVPRRNGWIG